MTKDLYKVLGVDKNATAEEIKKKYKKLAVQYHPDKQQGKSEAEKRAAEEKFKEINEAYSILSDKDKRQQYDTFGTVDGSMGGMSGADAMAEFMKHFQDMGGFGSMFEDSFFGGGKAQRVAKGSDIQVNVNVTMEELYNNVEKEIKYKHKVKCNTCNGTGSADGTTSQCPYCNGTGFVTTTQRHGFAIMQQTTVCPHCNGQGKMLKNVCNNCGGSGLVVKEEKYRFRIPFGATNGAYLIVEDKGNAAPNGGNNSINGDMRLVFVAKPHSQYRINEQNPYDIDYIKELPIIDCITGTKIKFKHLDGKDYTINVKPGVTDGFIIKVRDKGIMKSNGQRGFLNVVIHQKMPKTLNDNEKKLLNELKKSKNFK